MPITNNPPACFTISCAAAISASIFSVIAARCRLVVDAVEFFLQPHFQIAAQLDVGAAARHVGGDRYRARRARLGNDLRFLLVITCVQHGVRNALFL